MDSRIEGAQSNVELRQSPLSKPGNLTGTPRKVRDNAAEMHYLTQKWNSILLESYGIMERTLQVKQEGFNITTVSAMYAADPQENFYEKIDNTSGELEEALEKLASTVSEMGKIVASYGALVKLETLKNNETSPVFLTWPIKQYEIVSREMYEAYKQELSSKMAVRKNILALNSASCLQSLAAMWRIHCFLSAREEFLLESMLKETGHR